MLKSDEFVQDNLDTWPNCTTPDCENKQCTWAGMTVCFPCGTRSVGLPEMIRRFNATHTITWEEARNGHL